MPKIIVLSSLHAAHTNRCLEFKNTYIKNTYRQCFRIHCNCPTTLGIGVDEDLVCIFLVSHLYTRIIATLEIARFCLTFCSGQAGIGKQIILDPPKMLYIPAQVMQGRSACHAPAPILHSSLFKLNFFVSGTSATEPDEAENLCVR